ncbi:MAG: hypothetical protein WCR33_01660 [Bacilli bacterium]
MKIKTKIKICTFVLAALILTFCVNVDAIGYTYDHNSEPIYSTEGLVVNQTPYIYSDMGLSDQSQLNNPSDLFVYEKEGSDSVVYLLNQSTSTSSTSSFYVLNSSLQMQQEVYKIEYAPADFTDADLLAMKSNGSLIVNTSEDNTTLAADAAAQGYGFASVEDVRSFDVLYITLNSATSVYRGVAENSIPATDYIYVCDTGNNQILMLDSNSYSSDNNSYQARDVITSPTAELMDVAFKPIKVINDAAGRVYTIANGVTDGIMEFSEEGTFDRYIGTNYITLSAWDIFWRNFATEAQLEKYSTLLNTTFTSMVYKDTMIYTTSYAITTGATTDNTVMIKKINPSASDVLRRNGYSVPMGDCQYIITSDDNGSYGPSQFVGITVNDYGMYTVVDKNRGRLFTYDNEGNLLYISGGSGIQTDKINSPVAVQYLGEKLLVLDSQSHAILVFEPTEIASYINQAIENEYNGRNDGEWIYEYDEVTGEVLSKTYEKGAYDYWVKVVELNANYEYAYIGIGTHYKNLKDYKTAMYYYEKGADQSHYGKAYDEYRGAIIKVWFAPVVITIVGLVVLKQVVHGIKKRKRRKSGIIDEPGEEIA